MVVAYTKPQQRKKEESEKRRGERGQIKFINKYYSEAEELIKHFTVNHINLNLHKDCCHTIISIVSLYLMSICFFLFFFCSSLINFQFLGVSLRILVFLGFLRDSLFLVPA